MIRLAARGVVVLVLTAAVLDSAGRGQPAGTPDKVYYRDKKDGSVRSTEGELKPTPAGYQVLSGGKVVLTVSPADIVRVIPGDLPGLDRLKDVLPQVTLEEKKEWEKARVNYLEQKKKLGAPADKTRRYLEYKVALASAKVADEAREEDGWKQKAEEAVRLLELFLTEYKSGWEVWSVGRTLARLQSDLDKHPDAAATWGRLARSPDVPADLQREAAFQEVDCLVRGQRYTDASARLAELAKGAGGGPAAERAAIYQLAVKAAVAQAPLDAVGPVEKAIGESKDPVARATGYSMLGELFLAGGKPRDAMWSLLWVEVVYSQDKDLVAKAMNRLVEIFRQQGDEERVRAYRDRLREFRSGL
jgi:hypothetical protein